MQVLRMHHAGLELYQRPKGQNRWHLPVCSALRKEELGRLRPNNATCWEEVDIDGCPTMCYVFTGGAVKEMNRARTFPQFFAQFRGYLGEGPAKAFFYDLWLKDHNLRAKARNDWEFRHHAKTGQSRYHSVSIRNSAAWSIW